jgi:type VII secretion integral membrane protein EccD
MATRFTRVTVVGDGRQVDVSLPADTPLAEQLPMLLRLLSVPPSPMPVRWALSTPELGPIARDRSLDEAGILDGMVLYLTEAAAAPPPPFVDDVEDAAAAEVVRIAPAWVSDVRRSGIAWLLAGVLLAAITVAFSATGPTAWLGAAVAGLLGLAVGAWVPGPGGLAAALVAVPAAAVVTLSATGSAARADLLLALTVAAVAVILAGAVRRQPGLIAGGAVGAALALGGWICARLDLPADRTAGLVLLGTVIAVGVAGQLALGGAGLVDLVVADERGEKVPRAAVTGAVRRGQAIATGVVWAACLGAGAACWTLLATGGPGSGRQGVAGWIAPALGGLGGLIFLLRSRMFSRARQVGPMLAVGVLAAVGTTVQAPRWLQVDGQAATVTLGLLALVGAVVAAAGFTTVSDVPRARMRRTWEWLETLALLALIPGLILLFDAIGAVKRWIG